MRKKNIRYLPPPPGKQSTFKRVVFKSNPNDFLSRFEEFAYYIKEYEIDLFCGPVIYRQFYPLFNVLLFKLSKIPAILSLHGVFDVFINGNYINNEIYQLADALIILSRVDKKFWGNFGCNAYYIPNPIPLDVLNNQTSIRNPKLNKKNILWVGRIDRDKQPWELIPIMAEVVKYIPDVKLNVIGRIENKNLFDYLQNQVKANHLENNINFLGYHLDVRKFYEEADVMLMTSPREGFPFVVSESFLFSLPIVCYELPYLEFFRDTKGFISVRQQDRHGAAMALVEILKNDELRCQMSKEAYENIQRFVNYDIAKAWQKVFNDVKAGIRHNNKNFEMEQIQLLMMKSIFDKNAQINNMNMHIQNLTKALQQAK